MNSLFQFDRHKSQRRKKLRGAVRRTLRASSLAPAFNYDFGPDDWFNFSHQHLDWGGLGDLNPELRRIFLQGYARLFRHFAQRAHLLGKPYQLWIHLCVDDAGQDAVYFLTPNPHSTFPTEIPDVRWELPGLLDLFSSWLPEFSLVAGRSDRSLFLYAEGYGVPLRQ